MPPAWTLSLPDYLGPIPVYLTNEPRHERLIELARRKVMTADRSEFREVCYPWRPEFRFLVRMKRPQDLIGAILVEDARTGKRIGGAMDGLPVMLDGYRWMGAGTEMVCLSDSLEEFALRPSSYSLNGFRARCAAHRVQTERALEVAPEVVCRSALEWYHQGPLGMICLDRPWTPEMQIAHARQASVRR